MKRDLTTDLKSIQEGRTLFDDPDPSVGTKYELYEVAEHAIGRAIKAEKALGNETILNGVDWEVCDVLCEYEQELLERDVNLPDVKDTRGGD